MKYMFKCGSIWLWAALACVLSAPVQAELITNGGFESGFSGWTVLDQVGSEGAFALQTGTTSPVNSFTVPAPPQGTTAAMTDALGPGSHVLYQDFVVPSFVPGALISFSLFINNGASNFVTPDHLDFATPALNQQARVDIIRTSADPFSLAPADVLQTLYRTMPGDPLVSGYNEFLVSASPLLQANPGATLRLRFAEVDNVAPFNFGVDNVSISEIPEPATWVMTFSALLGVAFVGRRRFFQRKSCVDQ